MFSSPSPTYLDPIFCVCVKLWYFNFITLFYWKKNNHNSKGFFIFPGINQMLSYFSYGISQDFPRWYFPDNPGACMAKQRSWNFCGKNQEVFVTSTCENWPHSYVVVMNVSFCDCAAQLSSYTTVLDRCKIVQSLKYFIDIHQTCRYGQRYI